MLTSGLQKKEIIEYDETFAAVVKFYTLRIFFAIAVHHLIQYDQMDVKTEFLYDEREKDIYMEKQEGFVSEVNPDHAWKFQKALYGLKKSPRQWHKNINYFLIYELHLKSPMYDPCV